MKVVEHIKQTVILVQLLHVEVRLFQDFKVTVRNKVAGKINILIQNINLTELPNNYFSLVYS